MAHDPHNRQPGRFRFACVVNGRLLPFALSLEKHNPRPPPPGFSGKSNQRKRNFA
jgi:hypothetical protein